MTGDGEADLRVALLAAVADTPATVEVLAMLGEPRARVVALGGGHLVVSAGGGLAATVGDVDPVSLRSWLAHPGFAGEILVPAGARAVAEPLAAGWRAEEAIVFVLSGSLRARPPAVVVAPLTAETPLEHLPAVLREEIDLARRGRVVQAAWVAGQPVSFAYCCWESEHHGDLSVDTLAPLRGRHLAEAALLPVLRDLVARGKTPVWGALADNRASLALGHRLGFDREAGRLWVLSRA